MVIKKSALQSVAIICFVLFLSFGCSSPKVDESSSREVIFLFSKAEFLSYDGIRVHVISEFNNGTLVISSDSLLFRSKLDLSFAIKQYNYVNDSLGIFSLSHPTYHSAAFHIFMTTVENRKTYSGILLFGERGFVFPDGLVVKGERKYIPRVY